MMAKVLFLGFFWTLSQSGDGKTFQPFASLPLPLSSPGLVSLGKGGGRGDFFLVGGQTTDYVPSKKAFIYDAGSWREVADMPTVRYGKEQAKFRLIKHELMKLQSQL